MRRRSLGPRHSQRVAAAIRAHGSLQLEDNMDNRGKLVLRRNGSSDASITRADGSCHTLGVAWA